MEREMIIDNLEDMCDLLCGSIEEDYEDCGCKEDDKGRTEV